MSESEQHKPDPQPIFEAPGLDLWLLDGQISLSVWDDAERVDIDLAPSVARGLSEALVLPHESGSIRDKVKSWTRKPSASRT